MRVQPQKARLPRAVMHEQDYLQITPAANCASLARCRTITNSIDSSTCNFIVSCAFSLRCIVAIQVEAKFRDKEVRVGGRHVALGF